MCEDYRVNDLQVSLEQATARYRKAEAKLTMAQERSEMLERLYREMIRERYKVGDAFNEAISIGNRLVELVSPHVVCTCRRDWVCHKCQVINEWKGLSNG